MNFPEAKISKLLRSIYAGKTNPRNLPVDLYTATAKHLVSGAYAGFGFDLKTAKGKKLAQLLDLRENVYIFSGAKTFQQTTDMFNLLRDEKGKLKTFKKYEEDVRPIYDNYNTNWLKAEYETAIGQSQIADQWIGIIEDKEQFPLLKYSAIVDANTSDICLHLDGICRPVDDPFWREWAPLNHFSCRCILIQTDRDSDRITRSDTLAKKLKVPEELIKPAFKMNAGISGEIYSKKHPYFDVPKEDKAFARKNFNLPIPEKD